MHPHLHDKKNIGCYDVVMALEACHNRGFLYKAVGMCNGLKHDVTMCLRAERIQRTKANHEKAREKREKIAAKWSEIDAMS